MLGSTLGKMIKSHCMVEVNSFSVFQKEDFCEPMCPDEVVNEYSRIVSMEELSFGCVQMYSVNHIIYAINLYGRLCHQSSIIYSILPIIFSPNLRKQEAEVQTSEATEV